MRDRDPTEANKEVVRRFYEEPWNRWRLDLADQIVAQDLRFRALRSTLTRRRGV